MSTVSVTTESLSNVKRAFSDFQTDIESFSSKIGSCTEQIMLDVKQSLKKQEDLVHSLEDSIISVNNEIEQMQSSIIAINARIITVKAEIADQKKQQQKLETQISQLEQQRQNLASRHDKLGSYNSSAESTNVALNNQIQRCRETLHQINGKIASAQKQQAEFEGRCFKLKESKRLKENCLFSLKNELNKAKSKLERLVDAGDSVFREVNNLELATRKFEQNTSAYSEKSKTSLTKCITEIDEYLRTSLASLGNHSSDASYSSPIDFQLTMNTPEELQQIREMETRGEFDISPIELMNAHRSMSGLRIPKIEITLPANTRRYTMESFCDQVLSQEDGLNSLSVYDFINNYENMRNNGRDTQSNLNQQQYRQAVIEQLICDYLSETPEMSLEQARTEALETASLVVALHNPDQIVGGFGFSVTGAGLRNVNSALGSLWRHGRARRLYEDVRNLSRGWSEEQMRNTYLNIRLNVVDRYASSD